MERFSPGEIQRLLRLHSERQAAGLTSDIVHLAQWTPPPVEWLNGPPPEPLTVLEAEAAWRLATHQYNSAVHYASLLEDILRHVVITPYIIACAASIADSPMLGSD